MANDCTVAKDSCKSLELQAAAHKAEFLRSFLQPAYSSSRTQGAVVPLKGELRVTPGQRAKEESLQQAVDLFTPASTKIALQPLRNNVAKCTAVFWSGSLDTKKDISGKIDKIQSLVLLTICANVNFFSFDKCTMANSREN